MAEHESILKADLLQRKESTVPYFASNKAQFHTLLLHNKVGSHSFGNGFVDSVSRCVCEKINIIINTQQVLLLTLISASRMCQMVQISNIVRGGGMPPDPSFFYSSPIPTPEFANV